MYSKVLHSKCSSWSILMKKWISYFHSPHYRKAAKLRKKLPPDIIYPRNRSWKGEAVVPANGNKDDILLKHALTNVAECVPKDQERGVLFVK